jgi:hypothetical protein
MNVPSHAGALFSDDPVDNNDGGLENRFEEIKKPVKSRQLRNPKTKNATNETLMQAGKRKLKEKTSSNIKGAHADDNGKPGPSQDLPSPVTVPIHPDRESTPLLPRRPAVVTATPSMYPISSFCPPSSVTQDLSQSDNQLHDKDDLDQPHWSEDHVRNNSTFPPPPHRTQNPPNVVSKHDQVDSQSRSQEHIPFSKYAIHEAFTGATRMLFSSPTLIDEHTYLCTFL